MITHISILLFSMLSLSSYANVVLPALIGDNMVLQQDAPVHLWGKANAGEKLKIHILQQNIELITDENGNWETWLKQ